IRWTTAASRSRNSSNWRCRSRAISVACSRPSWRTMPARASAARGMPTRGWLSSSAAYLICKALRTDGTPTDTMHLLIVEDDAETASYMRKGLTEAGYTVDHADNGRDGLFLATSGSFDAIIMDRMLPGLDGLSVVQAMRAAKITTPVLILSALGQVDDRVKGLRAGGDDYLSKPFAFSELHARIEALLRRRDVQSVETKLTVGDLELDLLSRKVRRGDKPIDLQPRE